MAQNFLSERGLLQVSYFHNQYGRQIEPVPAMEVPALLPQLSPSDRLAAGEPAQQCRRPRCKFAGISCPGNRERVQTTRCSRIFFFAPAIPTWMRWSSGPLPPMRFSLLLIPVCRLAGAALLAVPIGAFSPLRGARPFNRPPHTGLCRGEL